MAKNNICAISGGRVVGIGSQGRGYRVEVVRVVGSGSRIIKTKLEILSLEWGGLRLSCV